MTIREFNEQFEELSRQFGEATNGKSLLNIIGACIKCGAEIEIECNGPDEEEALKAAIEMIESGLGE